MKTYIKEELKEILELHKKWLRSEEGGIRANLINFNLSNINLSNTNLSYMDLSSSNLRNSDLSYADLRNSNLSNSDLRGADLNSCNLSYAIGEMRFIKSLQCEKYSISYTHNKLNIGCKSHSIEEWRNFTDEEISKMDVGALEWWTKWKPILMNIIEVSPCEAYKNEETKESK